MTSPTPSGSPGLTVDALAQEIRRVDGNHDLGAAALAEALIPFIESRRPSSPAVALSGEEIEQAVAAQAYFLRAFASSDMARFIPSKAKEVMGNGITPEALRRLLSAPSNIKKGNEP